MGEYQLTASDVVIRAADGAHIPADPSNRDRAEYEQWLAAGGVPDPYVPPPTPPPVPQTEHQVLYAHENRLRTLEGQPPFTFEDFIRENSL